jgi:hypothetical protein
MHCHVVLVPAAQSHQLTAEQCLLQQGTAAAALHRTGSSASQPCSQRCCRARRAWPSCLRQACLALESPTGALSCHLLRSLTAALLSLLSTALRSWQACLVDRTLRWGTGSRSCGSRCRLATLRRCYSTQPAHVCKHGTAQYSVSACATANATGMINALLLALAAALRLSLLSLVLCDTAADVCCSDGCKDMLCER